MNANNNKVNKDNQDSLIEMYMMVDVIHDSLSIAHASHRTNQVDQIQGKKS